MIWYDDQPIAGSEDFEYWILARAQGLGGLWGPVRVLSVGELASQPRLAVAPTGFLASWDTFVPGQEGTTLRPLDRDLDPQEERQPWSDRPVEYAGIAGLATAPGGYALLFQWRNFLNPNLDCPPCNFQLRLAMLDATGTERIPEVNLNGSDTVHAFHGAALLPWRRGGRSESFLVTYLRSFLDATDAQGFVQALSSSGQPLGEAVALGLLNREANSLPSVAAAPDGRFVVAWARYAEEDGLLDVYARRFDSDGTPLGPEFRVNQITLSDQTDATVAMDAQGNFVVAWSSYNPAFSP
ncbi:MAG TPA: hypothetical protein PK413_04740, partial [Thermoanaerobaculia bacterium]|nr:hypothetical protein [Thermoanaerobaculia bacterium]